MKFAKFIWWMLEHKFLVFWHMMIIGRDYPELYPALIWQGFWHDMDKFAPIQLYWLSRFYHDKTASMRVVNHAHICKYNHRHTHPHHWEFWLREAHHGRIKPRPMPLRFRIEMLADWYAYSCMARRKMIFWPKNVRVGFSTLHGNMFMHPNTMKWFVDALSLQTEIAVHGVTEDYVEPKNLPEELTLDVDDPDSSQDSGPGKIRYGTRL